MQNITMEYFANGLVLGTLWDGSEGTYPLKWFPPSGSVDGLLKTIADCLESSSDTLTGARDFASETGALVRITCVSTIIVGGCPFYNETEIPEEFVGNLTEEQQNLLFNNR